MTIPAYTLPRLTPNQELALYRAVSDARRLILNDEAAHGAITWAALRHGCNAELVAMLVTTALDGVKVRAR